MHGCRVLIPHYLMIPQIFRQVYHLTLHAVLHPHHPLHNIFSGFVQKLAREMDRGQQLNHQQFGGRRDQQVSLADPQVQLA